MHILKTVYFSVVINSIILLGCIGLALFTSFPAYAAEESYTDTIPIKSTNWRDTLSIPKFDPAKGILTKIEFVLAGEVSGRARLENLDAEPATVIAESKAGIDLTHPNGQHFTSVNPNGIVLRDLAVFDGEIDFAGASGTIIENIVGIDVAERVVVTDAESLLLFTGTGTVDMAVRAVSQSSASGAGNLALSFSTSAGAAITVTYTFGQPAIALEKSTNGFDADSIPGPILYPNEAVTWTYVITNIGEIPLVDLTLLDDKEGNLTANCPQTTLDIAASMTCTHVGVAQHGQYTNTAFVTGTVPSGLPGTPRQVTADDPSHYFAAGDPAIDLEKFTNGNDADQLPGPLLRAGDVVTWSYLVSNVGGIELEKITLLDTMEGAITTHCPQQRLAVGEQMVCEVIGTAQLGQYTNIAVVTGTTPIDAVRPNITVTDEDPSNYFGVQIDRCPLDNAGNVLLPDVQFLGEGAGQYMLPIESDEFVVKKLAPFRFINQITSPYLAEKRSGAPERIWSCKGECLFQHWNREVLSFGPLPLGTILHMVILDDDPDERINSIFAENQREQPFMQLTQQDLTNTFHVTLPTTDQWYLDVLDSIGIYTCIEQ